MDWIKLDKHTVSATPPPDTQDMHWAVLGAEEETTISFYKLFQHDIADYIAFKHQLASSALAVSVRLWEMFGRGSLCAGVEM